MKDPWLNQDTFVCKLCMYYGEKTKLIGRCRKNAPTMDGYPVVFASEAGCGKHKLNWKLFKE